MNIRRIVLSTIVLPLLVCAGISPVSAQGRFTPLNPQAQPAADKPAAGTAAPSPAPAAPVADTTAPVAPTPVAPAADTPAPSLTPVAPVAAPAAAPAADTPAPSSRTFRPVTGGTAPADPLPPPPSTTPLQPLPPAAVTGTPSAKPTAEMAQKLLEEGNARFVAQQRQLPNSGLLNVQDTAKNGQHPFVTILSCGDSRVPLEIIFDRGIGDIFVIRVAGNVAGESETGSIEYAAEHVGTPLLVILGHTKCGAVTAAATHAHTEGSLTKLIERILPAVDNAKQNNPDLKDEELIDKAVVENVWVSIKTLMQSSEIIRRLVKEEKLWVVGAIYDIETGAVKWLGEPAGEKEPTSAPPTFTSPTQLQTGFTPVTVTAPVQPPAPPQTGFTPVPGQPLTPTPFTPGPGMGPAQPPVPAPAVSTTLTMELLGPDAVRWDDNVIYTLVVRNIGKENAINLNLKLVQANSPEPATSTVDKPLLPGEKLEIPIQVSPGRGREYIDIAVSATDSQGLKSEVNRRIQVLKP